MYIEPWCEVVIMWCSNGWVDIWSTPKASVNIGYKYHPIPPSGREMDEFPGTPDGEETILIPFLVAQRPLRPRTQGRDSSSHVGPKEFDPTTMDPDNIDVRISIGASVCYAYGSLVCNFFNLKVCISAMLQWQFSVLHFVLVHNALSSYMFLALLSQLVTNCCLLADVQNEVWSITSEKNVEATVLYGNCLRVFQY